MIALFVVCGGGGGGDYLCSSILLVCLVLFKQSIDPPSEKEKEIRCSPRQRRCRPCRRLGRPRRLGLFHSPRPLPFSPCSSRPTVQPNLSFNSEPIQTNKCKKKRCLLAGDIENADLTAEPCSRPSRENRRARVRNGSGNDRTIRWVDSDLGRWTDRKKKASTVKTSTERGRKQQAGLTFRCVYAPV